MVKVILVQFARHNVAHSTQYVPIGKSMRKKYSEYFLYSNQTKTGGDNITDSLILFL